MIAKCPHCQKEFNVPDEYKDKKVKCLKCNQQFVAKTFIRKSEDIIRTKTIKPNLATQPVEEKVENGKPKCSNCGSDSILTMKEGYSAGSGCCGAIILGPLGLLCGAFGSNKLFNVCQKCGNKWRI